MPSPLRSPGRPATPAAERGAALVVGLILLVILTLLAIAGMSTSTTELVMAGNEQFRRNAATAASAGIERAVAQLDTIPTTLAAAATVVPATPVAADSPDRYTTSTRYVGEERGLPQSSADKFIALHFQIDSTGTAARNATDRQVQGALIVAGASASSESNVGRTGAGLP
jgi:Tfp pilus assembly protein PilX